VITRFCRNHSEMSINRACKVLKLSRSTYYYLQILPVKPNRSRGRPVTLTTYNIYEEKEVPDETVIQEIEEVLSQKFILYGYKKITAVLRRRGCVINPKKVYRLMKEKGLLLKEFPCRKCYRRKGEIEEGLDEPNRRWNLDIKHGKADNGEKGYVIAVKDCFKKEIIACETSRRHTGLEVEKVMYLALANRNLKEFPIEELPVTAGNGKEIVKAMKSLRDMGIVHCRITPRSP